MPSALGLVDSRLSNFDFSILEFQYSTFWYSTFWYSTFWYSTFWYSTFDIMKISWFREDLVNILWRFLDDFSTISRRFRENFVKLLWKFLGENVIFDTLVPHAFWKYATCIVFFVLCLCLYLCLCLCLCMMLWWCAENIIFDILAPSAFSKRHSKMCEFCMYGVLF